MYVDFLEMVVFISELLRSKPTFDRPTAIYTYKTTPSHKTKYTFKSSFKMMTLKNLSSSIGRKHAIKTSLTLLSVRTLE